MDNKIKSILEKISILEEELREELNKKEKSFDLKNGKICFKKDVEKLHKKFKKDIFTYIKEAPLLYILTAPFIYAMIIPAVILDIFVNLYQAINFRVYKIAMVKRSDYIVFDRHSLKYLNTLEKINCLYCSYFNGLMGYVSEIAARTELFWCPIRHAKKIAYRHSTYEKFLPYGDAETFRKDLEKLRKELESLNVQDR